MPGVAAASVEVLEREPPRVADHLRLVVRLPLVAELVAEVTERGCRLVADLALGQGGRGLGHRVQMLAHAQPIRGRVARHAAGASRPGSRRQPSQLVVAALAASIEDLAQVAPEAVDNSRQALRIYEVEVS